MEVLGPETFASLSLSLKTISEDPKWRVRLELVKSLAELAIQVQVIFCITKNPELFTKYIEPLYVFYLKDRASAIRSEAILHLGQFAKIYGMTWVNAFISRLFDVLTKESCFHFKIAAIYSLRELIFSVHGDSILEKVLNMIIQAANEPVPNVREACVKTEREIAGRYEKGVVRETIKKHSASMTEDTDFEVRHTALQAVEKL